jgi:hypothetical protein
MQFTTVPLVSIRTSTHTRAATARLSPHTTLTPFVSFEWRVLPLTGRTPCCPPASTTMPYRPPRHGASPRRSRRHRGPHLLFFFDPSSSVPASLILPGLQRQLDASLPHPPLSFDFLHVVGSRFEPSCRCPSPQRPPSIRTLPPSRPPFHHHLRLLHRLSPPLFLLLSSLFRVPLARGGRRLSISSHLIPSLLLLHLLSSSTSRRRR